MVDLGRDGHKIAKFFIQDFKNIHENPSKIKIQEGLKEELQHVHNQIDEILNVGFFQ